MYAESKVTERLDLAEREFGFRPEYHSVDEIDEFERCMVRDGKYTYDDFGRPESTRNLTEFDRRWILNEQLLVMCDAAYFLTRYAYLRSEEGVVARFNFRVPQRIYFDIVCDLEERGAAIEIMALKARQLGVSIFSELLIAHRVIFSHGVGAVIGSADQSKTSEMSQMLLLCYDRLPCWLRPNFTSRVESARGQLLFGHQASGVSFQHGSQKFGIATGSTPTVYHLSEVALYGDAAQPLIDEGLWKAVHASPMVLGILESTGRSNKGWWANTWYYSKSKWPNCRMFPMFLPWFCGVDIYPTPTDMNTHPRAQGWIPNRETRVHAARCALYVESSPRLKKYILSDEVRRGVRAIDDKRPWTMPMDQQWFWEWNYQEAKFKGSESSYLQEMAGDDEEALQRSEESVFGHETIAEIDTNRKRDYETFAIVGQSIEDAHEPDPQYFDYKKERIPVRYIARKNGAIYRWELVPVIFPSKLREDDPSDVAGVLLIFHRPQPNTAYSIGVDTSEGKGEDSTVISVWTYGSRGNPDVQCAELSSPFINHTEAYAFVMAIAAYYAQYMDQAVTKWREPYVSVEQVAAVGDTCIKQMRNMGYSNFHKMVRYDKKNASKKNSNQLGWCTWGWSRPILTGYFVSTAQNAWVVINSPWLIEEMKTFEVKITSTGKEKLVHEEGKHDDRIFAAAMAVFCPHDMDLLANRSKKRLPEQTALPPIDLSPYTGQVVTALQLRESRATTLDDILYSDPRRERYLNQ
jgi:hypothetical protein